MSAPDRVRLGSLFPDRLAERLSSADADLSAARRALRTAQARVRNARAWRVDRAISAALAELKRAKEASE